MAQYLSLRIPIGPLRGKNTLTIIRSEEKGANVFVSQRALVSD